jgi:DNA helicase HerA-like ATPase
MGISVDHLVNTAQGVGMRYVLTPHTRLAGLPAAPADPSFLVIGLAIAGVTTALILLIRSSDQERRDGRRTVFELVFPRDLTHDSVTAFMRGLASVSPQINSLWGRDSIVFEMLAGADGITHRMRVPDEMSEAVLGQLRAAVPGLRARPLESPMTPAVSVVREIRLAPGDGEIRTDQAPGFITGLLAAMQPLRADAYEELVYQVLVYPVRRPTASTRQQTNSGTAKPTRSLGRWAWQQLTNPEPAGGVTEDKVGEPWLAVVGRVGATSTARGRSGHLVGRVVGQLGQLDRSRTRFRTRPVSGGRGRADVTRGRTPILGAPVHANASEVATLIGWPIEGPTLPGLKLAGGRVFPPSRELPSRGLLTVGRATYPGLERPIGIAASDAVMHMLVTGPNGSGKSTLLLNLIRQMIEAGYGLLLIDPNGDLAQDVIDGIPQARIEDLIYINPGDLRPVALNPLACAPDDIELVADQVLGLIRQNSDTWGVTIDECLRNTLVLLAACGLTLVEVGPVLVDAGLRGRLLATLDAAFMPTAEYFTRFETWNPAQQAQTAAAVLNKITPLVDRRQIRAMLGQARPTWTMQQVFEEQKIVVASLPSGITGPLAADLIGGLLVSMAWNSGQARIAVSRQDRQPVAMIIDELPRFVKGGSDLADILARARGHGLGLIGAVQHIGQVPPMLRAALLSEARNKLILQPAADDASMLSRHMPGVTADDLLALEPRTAMASLVVGGRVTAPVTIATFPPPESTGHGDAARHASRLRYGRDRADVEAEIQARRRGPEPGPRGTRRLP